MGGLMIKQNIAKNMVINTFSEFLNLRIQIVRIFLYKIQKVKNKSVSKIKHKLK